MGIVITGLFKTSCRACAVPGADSDYAIADNHGSSDVRCRPPNAIRADVVARVGRAGKACEPARHRRVVYNTDGISNFLCTPDMINLLLDVPLPEFESVHLEGNHDDPTLDSPFVPLTGRFQLAGVVPPLVAGRGTGNWLHQTGLESLNVRLNDRIPRSSCESCRTVKPKMIVRSHVQACGQNCILTLDSRRHRLEAWLHSRIAPGTRTRYGTRPFGQLRARGKLRPNRRRYRRLRHRSSEGPGAVTNLTPLSFDVRRAR